MAHQTSMIQVSNTTEEHKIPESSEKNGARDYASTGPDAGDNILENGEKNLAQCTISTASNAEEEVLTNQTVKFKASQTGGIKSESINPGDGGNGITVSDGIKPDFPNDGVKSNVRRGRSSTTLQPRAVNSVSETDGNKKTARKTEDDIQGMESEFVTKDGLSGSMNSGMQNLFYYFSLAYL